MIPTTMPITVGTGTVWAELELAREVVLGKNVISEVLVATEPSDIVVITISVKTLGDTVAVLHGQRRFKRNLRHVHDCVVGTETEVLVGDQEAMVGTMSLASSSTRSNSKSKFPTPPRLVITTVCQVLCILLD